jgi:hypothetical protein
MLLLYPGELYRLLGASSFLSKVNKSTHLPHQKTYIVYSFACILKKYYSLITEQRWQFIHALTCICKIFTALLFFLYLQGKSSYTLINTVYMYIVIVALFHDKRNHIVGVMVNLLDSSAVDHGFEPLSLQAKD